MPFGTSTFVTKYIWPGTFRMTYMPELMAALDRSPIQLVGCGRTAATTTSGPSTATSAGTRTRTEIVRRSSQETWRLFNLLYAGTAGVMNDPFWQVTAYRMVLELPADLRAA